MSARMPRRFLVPLAAVALATAICAAHAQPPHPFAVAGDACAVDPSGFGGWLLSIQTGFYRMINGAVHAAKVNGTALWSLVAIGFAYGVFHAAGPGHGKAVIASYMVANERALRRGLVLSVLAAALQGFVAIAIVTVGAFVLGATAARMTQAAEIVEIITYAGVALLGAWLVWRKGRAFLVALRPTAAARSFEPAHNLAHGHGHASVGAAAVTDHFHGKGCGHDHVHDEHCGHFHAPDPKTLGAGFSWRAAILTVFSAGARPCSGAILVLVFAHKQDIYAAGLAATLAMSLGTAITTCALAATAVLFKGAAIRLLGGSGRGELIGRGVEVLAALLVLTVGLGLLFGAWGMAACA